MGSVHCVNVGVKNELTLCAVKCAIVCKKWMHGVVSTAPKGEASLVANVGLGV